MPIKRRPPQTRRLGGTRHAAAQLARPPCRAADVDRDFRASRRLEMGNLAQL